MVRNRGRNSDTIDPASIVYEVAEPFRAVADMPPALLNGTAPAPRLRWKKRDWKRPPANIRITENLSGGVPRSREMPVRDSVREPVMHIYKGSIPVRPVNCVNLETVGAQLAEIIWLLKEQNEMLSGTPEFLKTAVLRKNTDSSE